MPRAADDDWRRMGQEKFLPPGTTFVRRPYRAYSDSWDHDHCEFCGTKLVESGSPTARLADVLTQGFTTTAEHPRGADYHWVCEPCFRDFAEEFGWREPRGAS